MGRPKGPAKRTVVDNRMDSAGMGRQLSAIEAKLQAAADSTCHVYTAAELKKFAAARGMQVAKPSDGTEVVRNRSRGGAWRVPRSAPARLGGLTRRSERSAEANAELRPVAAVSTCSVDSVDVDDEIPRPVLAE